MSKRITISNRINVTLGLIAVFLLVLGTNRVDKRHFDTAQNALLTVYHDRVVAQDYVYKMNNLNHRKKIAYNKEINTSEIATINKEFELLLVHFHQTKLTRDESYVLKKLEANFNELKSIENDHFKESIELTMVEVPTFIQVKVDALQKDLNDLAQIQVSESKSVTGMAQKSLDSNQMMSSMEIWFLLIVGVAIQFVIFYRTKKSTKALLKGKDN